MSASGPISSRRGVAAGPPLRQLLTANEQQVFLVFDSILAGMPAGDGPYDEKGLRPDCDRVGQWAVRRLAGQIPLAGEEPGGGS
jgi:hypothetical protein